MQFSLYGKFIYIFWCRVWTLCNIQYLPPMMQQKYEYNGMYTENVTVMDAEKCTRQNIALAHIFRRTNIELKNMKEYLSHSINLIQSEWTKGYHRLLYKILKILRIHSIIFYGIGVKFWSALMCVVHIPWLTSRVPNLARKPELAPQCTFMINPWTNQKNSEAIYVK